MRRKHEPEEGTDNVLVELGIDDAEAMSARTILAVQVNAMIEKRPLSRTDILPVLQ